MLTSACPYFAFQRDPAKKELHLAYVNAANYSAGVYMSGAGYTLEDTLALAGFMHSGIPAIIARPAASNGLRAAGSMQTPSMEMSWPTKLCSVGARRIGKLALFWIWLVVAAFEFYHLTRGWDTSRLFFVPLFADNIDRTSLKNSRGDTVEFETEFPPGRDPDPTVIRLRRAHHWFSTTLLKAESHGRDYDARWLDQNTLEITLVFGCLVRLKTLVTTVGPIHISYRLAEGDRTLGPCPAGVSPYAEPLPGQIP